MPQAIRRVLPSILLGSFCLTAFSQVTLQDMPRYDRYEKLRRDISGSVVRGQITPNWDADSKGFTFDQGGKTVHFDIATGAIGDASGASATTSPKRPQRGSPERGRQFDTAFSADGKLKAVSRDWNVYLSNADGSSEVAVTTEGSRAKRIKFGIGSWVYGEELEVREAMWFSPDGKKLAFYRFDENPVKDYYIAIPQVPIQDSLNTEAYPKAGAPNPVVTLMVYDLASKKTTTVDTKFADPNLGEYVYDVRWAPDGKSLLFNRTNRKQNIMEFCAANPDDGSCSLIAREDQSASWAENHPDEQFLKDNYHFIWSSERDGFKNFYLATLDGKSLAPITKLNADADRIVKLDEDKKQLWYLARDGDLPYYQQLHRVNLDGTGDVRLTDPSLNHSISLAPDASHFTDTGETISIPPTTTLRDADGKQLAELAKSDLTKFDSLGLKKSERFSFTAADGVTKCYGYLQFPSDFDPTKKYPLVVSVYGGPQSGGSPDRFQTPNAITEFGFLVAWIDGRGTAGRGKAFRSAVYGKLGIVEIDDQAAGVAELAKRPYVDGKRVGIYGTSYGGYASLMCLLRHPETFAVSCSSSSVTDWRNYDSIYTERFMGLPSEEDNLKGYDAGSAMRYAKDLKGYLLLYYGTADNNVHPSNTLQLVQALENAGRPYDMQVGPDRGHSQMNTNAMWQYLVEHLIVSPPKNALLVAYQNRPSKARVADQKRS